MIEGILLPELDDDSRPFWDGCAAGELRVQACGECGRLRFPPRPMCPWCQSFAHNWNAVSGRGRVWSFVVPHAPLLPAYQEFAPYNVIVVELDEDPTIRMVGNLVASEYQPINSVDPYSIEIGQPVRVVFQRLGEGEEAVALPRWVRA
ncbi:MAG: OB-fold domain-containing protein [Actinobacteria bacterium]|nr:OB-fold domain-containing protein [Actinomycetota bacterium]